MKGGDFGDFFTQIYHFFLDYIYYVIFPSRKNLDARHNTNFNVNKVHRELITGGTGKKVQIFTLICFIIFVLIIPFYYNIFGFMK